MKKRDNTRLIFQKALHQTVKNVGNTNSIDKNVILNYANGVLINLS